MGSNAFMTSTRQAVVEYGDSVTSELRQVHLVPLEGGAVRPIRIPALETGVHPGWVTAYSEKWLTATLFSANSPVGTLVMSTGSDTTRVLRFPANRYLAPPNLELVLPDGEHLVKLGRGPADKEFTIYSLTIDGTTAREIGRVPFGIRGYNGWGTGLSPDGKFWAFARQGPPTSHIYDVDLTTILQLINKR